MAALQLRFPYEWAIGAPLPQARAPARPRLRHLVAMRATPVQAVIPIVSLWDGAGGGGDGKAGRKCSPYARAKTINVSKLGKRARQAAHTRSFWDVDLDQLRPKTRADCKNGPRPCPWVGCSHHLALTVDIERGSIKETFPQLKVCSDPEGDGLMVMEQIFGTCSLDAIEKHENDDGTEGVGGLIALYHAASSGKPLGQTPGMTIEEVGRLTNLSIERVRQLCSGAMQELRVKLRRLEG